MFEIVGTKSLDSNAIEFISEGVNFVGRTSENNGIQGKIQLRDFEPNNAYTITATVIGNYKYVKLQKQLYYCSQNINRLSPKPIISTWNEKIAYYLISNIQKFVSLYDGQQGGYKLNDIKDHEIQLPIQNGKINFEFMESFIAELEAQRIVELEAQRIVELEAYLLATGLKDYTLTAAEEKALQDFDNIKWEEFKLEDLFEINTSKKRFDANKVEVLDMGKFPYVVRMGSNNGQKGYINEDRKFLNDGNTISFGQDTATMFYQKSPYFTGDKIKILNSKNKKFNQNNAQFFILMMSKVFSSFSWGASSFNVKILGSQKIPLPSKNSEITFDFMEVFISAIQKLVIKDVVLYSESKINATKLVISK